MSLVKSQPVILAGISLFCLLWLLPFSAHANITLIQEVEKLRNSLPTDDPSRGEIALRLADLYFYEAADEQKKADLDPGSAGSAAHLQRARQYRQKSINFYQESLRGKTGAIEIKIRFQMARLLQAEMRKSEAIALWQTLSEQRLQPKIRTEALLRMAEHYEEQTTPSAMAKADEFFRASIAECVQDDLCTYVQYRHAWLLKNLNRLPEAIDKMQLALWDSKGQIREESLRDLVVFLADEGGDGSRALKIVETLAAKLNRPSLLADLSESFYSAGNKAAGTRILEVVNNRNPQLHQQSKLLEEYYGLREWDKMRGTFMEMEPVLSVKRYSALDEVNQKEVEKILRRLSIQLDGERKTNGQRNPEFKSAVMLYMALFPKSDANERMRESWLAATPDENEKMQQLQLWLADASISQAQRVHFLELRATVAQNRKDHNQLIAEMKALEPLYSDPVKKREAQYLIARAQYDLKQIDVALQAFRALAQPQAGKSPDKWAVISQNLILDILNERKDYAGLMASADLWLNHKSVQSDPSLKDEIKDMQKVRSESQFQHAVSLGDSPAALELFSQYCKNKQFLPQSCDNSRTLAVKLNNQVALIAVLESTRAESDLINEYEASGLFSEAARLREKAMPLAAAKWTVDEALKMALLYEMGGQKADQKRWLQALSERFKKTAFSDKDPQSKGQEDLVYLTLDEAGLIGPASLSIQWTPARRQKLAAELEARGQGNAQTRQILLDSKESLGPLWTKYILQETQKRFDAQAKIQFYGRNSQSKFQERVKKLKDLEDFVNLYLQGASREARLHLLHVLVTAYQTFEQQIIQTPLPEGLDDEALAQIQKTLQEMSQPFKEAGNKFLELARTESSKLEDPLLKQSYAQVFVAEQVPAALSSEDVLRVTSAKNTSNAAGKKSLDEARLKSLMEKLRQYPRDAATLKDLKDLHQSTGLPRQSAYYQGRLEQVSESKRGGNSEGK